jgi:hypothetical protein
MEATLFSYTSKNVKRKGFFGKSEKFFKLSVFNITDSSDEHA